MGNPGSEDESRTPETSELSSVPSDHESRFRGEE